MSAQKMSMSKMGRCCEIVPGLAADWLREARLLRLSLDRQSASHGTSLLGPDTGLIGTSPHHFGIFRGGVNPGSRGKDTKVEAKFWRILGSKRQI